MILASQDNAPLCVQFNAAVMTIANRLYPGGYDVGEDAPDSLAKLKAHYKATGRVKVWSGASDHTIFGCPEHNWAFRAWHDWHHLMGNLEYTPGHEAIVASRQKHDLYRLYGVSDDTVKWAKLIGAEIIGQIEYASLHKGEFPQDQRQFVLAYLRHPAQAVLETF